MKPYTEMSQEELTSELAALKKELRILQSAAKAYEGFAKNSQLVEAVYEKCRKNRTFTTTI